MKVRTILFPTDFSQNAENAMVFAVRVAEKLNAAIVLFHSYHLPVIKTDVPIEAMEREIDKMEAEAKNKLEALAETIRLMSSRVNCITLLRRGFTVENIGHILEEEHIDLVVMGTKGASGIKEMILGSITADVLQKASCPVLAVPEDAEFTGFQSIVYAIDPSNYDCTSISDVVKLATYFESKFTLLAINERGDEQQKVITEIEKNILSQIHYTNTSLQVIENKNVLDGINNFILSHNVNLLVMATRKRDLFEKLFKTSLTKKMAFHTNTPLLSFHTS